MGGCQVPCHVQTPHPKKKEGEKDIDPAGSRTQNLLIRSQTPYHWATGPMDEEYIPQINIYSISYKRSRRLPSSYPTIQSPKKIAEHTKSQSQSQSHSTISIYSYSRIIMPLKPVNSKEITIQLSHLSTITLN